MRGGQINVFLSALPTMGPGALKGREDVGLYNTDKERSLFSPANSFWVNTADEASESGIGINTFFFPDQYTDVATIGALSSSTSGQSFFHPRFDPTRDRHGLQAELVRLLSADREIGYDATLRVRCSAGLRVQEHLGGFYQRASTDLELGCVNDQTAIGVTFRHDARLDEKEMAYVQVATLYTTASGDRRVRVCNLALGVTSLIGNVFRFADLDAVVTIFAKEGKSFSLLVIVFGNRRELSRGKWGNDYAGSNWRQLLINSRQPDAKQDAPRYQTEPHGEEQQGVVDVSPTLRCCCASGPSKLSLIARCSSSTHEANVSADSAGKHKDATSIYPLSDQK